ncbi:MAG TPA: ABC transporter permease [Phycisphaerae bacterium]|nr:ABC transporter permease [Phycisphaerae bacterium]HPS52848.1 ABC transporter permease [Phycisphaerae bacterium]
MSDENPKLSRFSVVRLIGARTLRLIGFVGGMSVLFMGAMYVILMSAFSRKYHVDVAALARQVVRIAIRSLGIVCLVQIFIGVILALQLEPTLKDFGQESQIASIIGIGGFRMLGPIITAVVLSGFAGASIAAEIGTMVVSEEIEAMEAMALNPVRFLVVPRLIATFLAMLLLTPIADLMIALGGYVTARLVLGPTVYSEYWQLMRRMLEYKDFWTGMIQAGVFGILISLIACREGLLVHGGAEGVGKATTMTVVNSIVAIVAAAGVCTVIFYVFKL